MKPRNLVITGTEERLKVLEAEYRMIGFYTKRTAESLTVFTRRPSKQNPKKRRNRRGGNDRGRKDQKSKSRNN